jgi:hypothetical protein
LVREKVRVFEWTDRLFHPLGRVVLETVRWLREKVLLFFLQALEDWVAGLPFEQKVREVRETWQVVRSSVRPFLQTGRELFAADRLLEATGRCSVSQALLCSRKRLEDWLAGLSFDLQVREVERRVRPRDLTGLWVFQTTRLVFVGVQSWIRKVRRSTLHAH